MHLLFTHDPHRRTSETEWRHAIAQTHAELGLGDARLEGVGVAVLPALSASDLHAAR